MPIIKLPNTSPYTYKDQHKADKANKFIGRGSPTSSTEAYRKAYAAHNLANTHTYENTDFVFISAEGNRRNRLAPDYDEIYLACVAGATLITDNPSNRNRPYNVGEQQVAWCLENFGYKETEPGIWRPK